MQKIKFNPSATIIAQLPAGIEVEAVISYDGTMYVPIMKVPTFKSVEAVPTKRVDDLHLDKKVTKEVTKEEVSSGIKKYSEDELMEMDAAKELLPLCKKLGINADAEEGKNTNKKLRLLILEAQKGSIESVEEEEKPKNKEEDENKTLIEDFEDLEKGDEVEVYWESMKTSFKGTVKSKKGSKIVVYYHEDETEELLDEEEHTKVYRLSGVEI